jgi:hypothetical protein
MESMPNIDRLSVRRGFSTTVKRPDKNGNVSAWAGQHPMRSFERNSRLISCWTSDWRPIGESFVRKVPRDLSGISQTSRSSQSHSDIHRPGDTYPNGHDRELQLVTGSSTQLDGAADANDIIPWMSYLDIEHSYTVDSQRGIRQDTGRTRKTVHQSVQSSNASDLKCSSCHQIFTAKKSLLRHVRTVHRSKAFSCSHCGVKFTRKDTRDRHEGEKHSQNENTIRCAPCGRYVSKRALAEHHDSEICRQANASARQDDFQTTSVKFVGADDDPFLAALRMLKFFGPDSGNETVAYIRLKLKPRNPQETTTIWRYESCVDQLIIDRLSTAKTLSRALGMAALLLGFMAMSGQKIWGGKASVHFQGAGRILRTCHDSVCNCADHKSCPLWSPFAPRNPEVGILNRLLRDIGIDHRLLEAYTPEQEAALARKRYGNRGACAELP